MPEENTENNYLQIPTLIDDLKFKNLFSNKFEETNDCSYIRDNYISLLSIIVAEINKYLCCCSTYLIYRQVLLITDC